MICFAIVLSVIAFISTPDEVLLSTRFAGATGPKGLDTNVFIPVRGSYGLYLRFDGSPDELGLAAEREHGWFQKQIDYPLRLEIKTNGSCLFCTNLDTLIRAKSGRDVVFYDLAFLTINQPERVALAISDSSTNGPLKQMPTRIELHRSPIIVENAHIRALFLKGLAALLFVTGVGLVLCFRKQAYSL